MNNEDKIMKTLDVILNRLDNIEEGQKSTDKRLDKIDERLDKMDGDLKDTKNILIRMEQEHGKKLDTLFDAFEVNADKNKDLEKRVTVLENKSDSMDLHLKAVMHKQKASNQ